MFSIDDDELDVDLDDEEFLLAACGIPLSNSTNCDTPTTSTVSITNSESNLPVQRTSTIPRKPLDSLANSSMSTENRPRASILVGNNNSPNQQTGRSCLSTNFNKTFQKFNSKANFIASKKCEQESGPPFKKFASSCSRNSSPCVPQESRNTANNFRQNRVISNYNNSSPSLSRPLNQTNKNCNNYTSNGTRISSPSPSFSGSTIRNNMSSVSPGTQSPRMFQTPNRRNQEQYKSFTPKHNHGTNKSGCCDISIDVTPSRKKSARKFPGPAGLLPKLNSGQSLDELSTKLSPVPSTSRSPPENLERPVSSQSQTPSEDEEFSRDPWIGMLKEYKQNVPAIMRYSIVQVMSEAAGQRLKHGKVPSLCVLMKTSSLTETDASIFLKDPTGEMHGTLHKKVLEEYPSELGPGAGLILKHVSVFSPSPRKHYLNITPGNIIHIYPPDPSHVSCSQPLASQGTQVSKPNSQHRITIDEPEIILETNSSDDKQQEKENSQQNLENFDELLEGLDDEDEILDEDLLAMY